MKPSSSMKILVVDDEQVQLDSIRRGLNLLGSQSVGVTCIDEAKTAYENATQVPFSLVITDLTMPGGSGHDLIEWLRERDQQLPVIVITGLRSSPDEDKVQAQGIPILRKPFSPDQLKQTIEAVTQAQKTI